jgi:hypothetical protein
MAKFRKKPVVVEAVQLTWQNWNEICEFAGVGHLYDDEPEGCWVDPADGFGYQGNQPPEHLSPDDAEIGLMIPTLEGVMLARQDDWIIRGVNDELYPCKPDIFKQTYDAVEEPSGVQPVTPLADVNSGNLKDTSPLMTGVQHYGEAR